MHPERRNYNKTVELINDISNLTGLDKSVVRTVLKTASLQLSHYVAEDMLSSGECENFDVELPFIGTLSIVHDCERPLTKGLTVDFDFTETFHAQLMEACREGKSPIEDAVIKRFIDVFVDKYQSVV